MPPILVTLIMLNLVAFAAYSLDKALAKVGCRRIPENALLVIMMLGVVGALAGMRIFHHKTSKSSFARKAVVAFIVGVAVLSLGIFYAIT